MHKTKFLVIGLFILLVILVVLAIRSSLKNENNIPITPSPTKAQLPKFNLLEIKPKEDTSQSYLPITQIEFSFNAKVNPQKFYYQVSPEVKTKVDIKPETDNILILSPEIIWQPGITTITVLPHTTSNDGKALGQSFTYQINTAFPKTPDIDVHY
ncbi:MAG: hypothetical protein UU73_C0002G0108 [Candidatus Daviesbacteria bacterium GW2011_GWA1_41_61]|uniref:SbsA Ig-like domain-containing protein n=1 Tax=Candidatus Daviesbacteria bacterium GW2011_GWA2_40_9 TaxID=1618424 RepID=A0A0G0U6E6_9BACT|nr:MAG: hypothetical protein UU26_C0019G0014 [Candidatus Daviesbacteria bacterium GW2011_GWC1_40_9]KKR82766.1 MAG: hypothetical protein UU29_C0009G0037 [Candidatus Daviesbacteria bacterium GW2011_GWA2_40_9]KKR93768.1 MAG: hypothetical protein UU44_C0001G0108 [Candidatus Daviesbacteria bacterium GW2011_GWB1_41_15]KKS15234.1 MAG: hypothetical protein UU73_C0002G0108 [Candidatus Daviesbacteria bacterium GW2011_GWA1_41_61]